MRLLCAALLGCLSALPAQGLALAQVAAPRMTPVHTGLPSWYGNHFSALDVSNPAAQMWARAGLVGLGGTAAGSVNRSSGGVVTDSGDHRGGVVQLRLVGPEMALNLARTQSHIDLLDSSATLEQTFDAADTRMDLALRFADWLALGVGRHNLESAYRISVPAEDDVRRRLLVLPGLSLRLGDLFYLGVATGSEKVRLESSAVSVLGVSDEDRRKVSRYGLGLARAGAERAFHFELYAERREPYTLPAVFTGQEFDDADLTGATFELVWYDLLLAIERIQADITRTTAGLAIPYTAEAQRISLGWAPRTGLAFVLSAVSSTTELAPDTTEIEGTWLTVAWQF